MAMVCLSDFEAYAKKYLPKIAWDYFAAGADDCTTRDENILAYKRIRFRPRMLRDVSVVDIRTKILGSEISFPVGIAPTGFHQLAWPDGEKSTARAARAMSTCYVASTYSTCTLEEISRAAPGGLRWFQLYIHRNRAASQQLVRRAEALGFRGLVLTADLPYTGKRRDDVRNGFRLPPHMKVKNLEGAFEVCKMRQGQTPRDLCIVAAQMSFPFAVSFWLQGDDCSEYGLPPNSLDPSVTWNDIYWLRSLTHLPIIIKGILTREDAELAVRHGVQAIIVSNHGGRQLDEGPATIDALVEVVEAVRGRVEVYVDGGIRKGSDVLKALALGAKCVFIGRPALWGLAYRGEEGLQDVLRILQDEFRLSMALAGCASVSEIGPHMVQFSKL
ncbi:2-Hydroxyacid oxidase 2 isoform X2 [Sylvia atricapilla]|uniref:2-Hydroxyacid oxidase 2 isoform X2 n=1 Tax=Sylvia atricapilla TaxID=48155 RepID=UPI0033923198